MCVVRGEEREERGRPRQAVGEHVYHGVRERESERQTAQRRWDWRHFSGRFSCTRLSFFLLVWLVTLGTAQPLDCAVNQPHTAAVQHMAHRDAGLESVASTRTLRASATSSPNCCVISLKKKKKGQAVFEARKKEHQHLSGIHLSFKQPAQQVLVKPIRNR